MNRNIHHNLVKYERERRKKTVSSWNRGYREWVYEMTIEGVSCKVPQVLDSPLQNKKFTADSIKKAAFSDSLFLEVPSGFEPL